MVVGEAKANPVMTDPFAEADEDTGETKQSQNYIHIRIQRVYPPLLDRFDIPARPLNRRGCQR